MSLPVAVFASGSGTNLQALLDLEASDPEPAWHVAEVVSDRDGIRALERARAAGRSARVVPVSGRSQEDVASETLGILEGSGVRVVLLAGYLRLVPASVVRAFRRRILNLHPALLPAFGGKGMYGSRVHQAVLDSGARVTGVTVHYVDEEYDTGTIFAQWPVPVLRGDTPESLAARIHQIEHVLYPLAAGHLCRAVAEGRQPTPFSLPGHAFGAADPTDLHDQMRRAFQP